MKPYIRLDLIHVIYHISLVVLYVYYLLFAIYCFRQLAYVEILTMKRICSNTKNSVKKCVYFERLREVSKLV